MVFDTSVKNGQYGQIEALWRFDTGMHSFEDLVEPVDVILQIVVDHHNRREVIETKMNIRLVRCPVAIQHDPDDLSARRHEPLVDTRVHLAIDSISDVLRVAVLAVLEHFNHSRQDFTVQGA